MSTPLEHTQVEAKRVLITPEMAESLLEHNQKNRPISDGHVKRIAEQILSGRWKFNGDTIKISDSKNVLDGQHRLWAILTAKRTVESMIIWGVPEDAFATMDTIRRPRSGADVLSLMGASVGRGIIASALTWLLRFQRRTIPDHRKPENRIENSDVEAAFGHHKGIERARERCARLNGLGSKPLLTMMYYVIANRDPFLAERMVTTLENPAAVGLDDPFFRLRAYFTNARESVRDPVMTLALIIKAANAAKAGTQMKSLRWQAQGSNPEAFPELQV